MKASRFVNNNAILDGYDHLNSLSAINLRSNLRSNKDHKVYITVAVEFLSTGWRNLATLKCLKTNGLPEIAPSYSKYFLGGEIYLQTEMGHSI